MPAINIKFDPIFLSRFKHSVYSFNFIFIFSNGKLPNFKIVGFYLLRVCASEMAENLVNFVVLRMNFQNNFIGYGDKVIIQNVNRK